MSLSPEFIAKARAIAFYRKFKVRRARRARRGERWCDSKGLPGWTKIGAGFFGEAWEHEEHLGYVVKISGRAAFGNDVVHDKKPLMDGWPTFAQHCQAHPHPNLPKILHFERLSVGISFGIMPYYEKIEPYGEAGEVVSEWRYHLGGGKGAPTWMWPIIGMRGALGMQVDLHGGNVMMDMDTGEYIMTDPFSFVTSTQTD